MKMILTPAKTPDEFANHWRGWPGEAVRALRAAVREASPQMAESLKWGHLLYSLQGPVLIIRAEPDRVLLGFFRGMRLLHLEPRMTGAGRYELRTLVLDSNSMLRRAAVLELVKQAAQLNLQLGDPRSESPRRSRGRALPGVRP